MKNITTRAAACEILNVPYNADIDTIKSAYRTLVKAYHPDETGNNSDEAVMQYQLIVESYEFLLNDVDFKPQPLHKARVIGTPSKSIPSASEYARWEKKYEKRKQEKKDEFIKMQEEYSAAKKKQQDDYDRVMKAIEAIRTARAIQALIKAKDAESEE